MGAEGLKCVSDCITLFAPGCAPHEEGKAVGEATSPYTSPPASKPSVPSFLSLKLAGLIISEEQKEGKISPCVCSHSQLLDPSLSRGTKR